jgi:hypothetical protein
MKHVVVLAPGDDVELHWQQPGLVSTISEALTRPRATSSLDIGDQIRLSVELLKDFYEHPRHRTIRVIVARIVPEPDGTATVWLTAADRQDLE